MTLVPLKLPPGIYRNGTVYQTRDRWYDANLVRWFEGTLRPLGGWMPLQEGGEDIVVTGAARCMLTWRDNDGVSRLGIGTNEKLYAFAQGALTDITPSDLTAGQEDSTTDVGIYGQGAYGVGLYGAGDPGQIVLSEADSWQLDTFGQYLVGCLTSDGRLLYWDLDAAEAVEMTNAPVDCTGVVVTPEGFVVALGAGGDVRQIQWASQRSLTVWAPAENNSAGDWLIEGKGGLMCGRRTKEETLLWTDKDLHVMRYIGQPFYYRITQVDTDCGILSRHAVAMVGGSRAIWMGRQRFYSYDGYVQIIPCDVSDYIFSDINMIQRHKITATHRAAFSEVFWFYPSSGSDENDRYVSYNYAENHWNIGTLARVSGIDQTPFDYPLWAGADGKIYEHERGYLYDGINPHAESGPILLGQGDRLMIADAMIPDERTVGDAIVTFYAGDYPSSTERTFGPYSLTTEPVSIRLKGRQIRIRIRQFLQEDWRIGEFRFDVRPSSRR